MSSFSRRLRGAVIAIAALLGAVLGWALSSVSAMADVPSILQDVRFGPSAQKTRIVLDMMGAPQYTLEAKSSGDGALIVTLNDARVPKTLPLSASAKGHVGSYAIKILENNQARISFTLAKPAKIGEVFVIEPSAGVAKHRLVIDFVPGTKAAFLNSVPSRLAATSPPTASKASKTAPPPANDITDVIARSVGDAPNARASAGDAKSPTIPRF